MVFTSLPSQRMNVSRLGPMAAGHHVEAEPKLLYSRSSEVTRRYSYHSGTEKGVRDSVPCAQDKDQLQISSIAVSYPFKVT